MRHSCLCVLLLSVLAALTSCNKDKEDNTYPGLKKFSFSATDALIANPERGFYSGSGFSSAGDSPISVNVLMAGRREARTLYMLEFWLKDFFESDISEDFLTFIRANLAVFRQGGSKCILRFGYSDYIKDLSNPDPDGPFDTTEEQVLRHIAQLKPILQEYSDVIYVLQAGFIGCWGEWHYTTHFNQHAQTAEDLLPRKHVVDALLDALPADRQVELRAPAFKMKMYNFSLADTLTLAEAHQHTPKARLGGHNDCFLVDGTDQGTFSGPSERDYWKAETRYTIMGGETCGLGDRTFCACGNARVNLAKQHFSYLNMSFHKGVLNYWKTNDCYNEFKLRLGYRLALTDGWFTKDARAGAPFMLVLKIKNDGFASIMNPRDAEFVLTNASGNVVSTWPVDSDPRYWMPDQTTVIDQTFDLPEGLSGEYTLSLNLPDPAETLRANPLFSIQLANEGIWDEDRGFNKLYTFKL